MRRPLRNYQKTAILKFLFQPVAFFAMEMRLGKSLTCLRWLTIPPRNCKKVLVVAPKTVLVSWAEELAKEGLRFVDLSDKTNKTRKQQLECSSNCYYLLNYEAVHKLQDDIKRAEFQAVVFDESTAVKNVKTKQTRACLTIARDIPVRACLSGYPAPESWLDIFTQMQVLNGGAWLGYNNFYTWRDRWAYHVGYKYLLRKQKIRALQEAYNAQAYCLTRRDAGFIESPTWDRQTGKLNSAQEKEAKHILGTWTRSDGAETQHAIVVASWLRKLCAGFVGAQFIGAWKYTALVDAVKQNKSSKVVVWCVYRDEMCKVQDALRENGIISVQLHGGIKGNLRRRRVIQQFKDQAQVLICQIKLGKYGLDFSFADVAVYFSHTFSSEEKEQSKDRVNMPGKLRQNLFIELVTEKTIETRILRATDKKLKNARAIIAKEVRDAGPIPNP